MIYLTKDFINYKIEDLPFFNQLGYNPQEGTYNNGTSALFPIETSSQWLKSLDYVLMTGHYLYGLNRDFREAYKNAMDGREFNINYSNRSQIKPLFTKDLFNLFLFGIVAAGYIKNMPDKPMHYLARPIADEKNDSLIQFLSEERQINRSYKRVDGTPYYNYILKKSVIMPNNALGSNRSRFDEALICPIQHFVPGIKTFASSLNELAGEVFKGCIEQGEPSLKEFTRTFIDSSWSPYLKVL